MSKRNNTNEAPLTADQILLARIAELEAAQEELKRLKEEAKKNNPLYRSVSQDEMMGYEDEFDLIDLDEEEF